MKKIITIFVLCFLFILPVSAEDGQDYSAVLEDSGAFSLKDSLPEETRDYLEQNGILLNSENFSENIKSENVFKHIWGLFKSGFKTPLTVCATVLSIIIVSAALSGLQESKMHDIALYVCAVAVISALVVPIYKTISATTNALKGLSVFMLSFIPVFSGITAASGSALTAAASSGVLLLATEGLSTLASFIILPLMGGYLSLSIGVSASPLVENSGIASAVKKIAIWSLSLISTVFLGVLEIQTAINSASDSVNMRTARFILGSSVPVAGSVLSETFSTVIASLSLLKTSVAIYGIIAVSTILLPIIVELLLWRLCLVSLGCCAELFSVNKVGALTKSLDDMLSILVGIVLLCAALFIISITVILTFTGKA